MAHNRHNAPQAHQLSMRFDPRQAVQFLQASWKAGNGPLRSDACFSLSDTLPVNVALLGFSVRDLASPKKKLSDATCIFLTPLGRD
jgi:hypothetical protein